MLCCGRLLADPRYYRKRGALSDVTNRSSREAVDSQTWFDEIVHRGHTRRLRSTC
jgi:hypothetical protein